MPNYGSAKYWDDRYASDGMGAPFDWLFDYAELSLIVDGLLPDKQTQVLLIGAGNAPFSPDLQRVGGYKNIINMDLSPVAMEIQRELFPEQQWLVMDVLNMSFPDASIPALIDKSLIDTLLCYSDSVNNTEKMIREVHRVLAPGARYITFSLHSPSEVLAYLEGSDKKWAVSAFRIRSSRWNTSETKRRAAVAYTMAVCDMPLADGVSFRPNAQHPLIVEGSLSDDEHACLQKEADDWNLTCALSQASVDALMKSLDKTLVRSCDAVSLLEAGEGDVEAAVTEGARARSDLDLESLEEDEENENDATERRQFSNQLSRLEELMSKAESNVTATKEAKLRDSSRGSAGEESGDDDPSSERK